MCVSVYYCTDRARCVSKDRRRAMSGSHILKNLHNLIRNAALTYMNEFVWQDVELTNEFKTAFSAYLRKNRYDIEFLGKTAVITSSSTKYIYVPNQWFVIASYAVEVYEELQRYKECFKMVSEKAGRRPDEYAKQLRDHATSSDKNRFIKLAETIFSYQYDNFDMVQEAAARLWRFVNDYSWWSGQKTIDRGDFHLSVILNMLNLVNASQSYVGDIVSAYANDSELRILVSNIDRFTINTDFTERQSNVDYLLPDEEIRNNVDYVGESEETFETIPKPERVRIKISGSNKLKEINY